jgi:hypothetical protein
MSSTRLHLCSSLDDHEIWIFEPSDHFGLFRGMICCHSMLVEVRTSLNGINRVEDFQRYSPKIETPSSHHTASTQILNHMLSFNVMNGFSRAVGRTIPAFFRSFRTNSTHPPSVCLPFLSSRFYSGTSPRSWTEQKVSARGVDFQISVCNSGELSKEIVLCLPGALGTGPSS